ncbi:MAG TPA: N-formylglutamate amidohydrolase [Methylomirabilota bacterium]|jgi:formiminoglutamase|nr:N-formylglutamate amidohydrolase [Methylomirabilota bacterium]
MDSAFPIIRRPAASVRSPVLVSVPHYGTAPLPGVTADDYRDPSYATFAYGFADAFARDLYGDLHGHGATVLATPYSRMFVDVNRRRDDVEHHDGEVRSRRGVVRTHTMRDVPIFARALTPSELEARLQQAYDPYYAALDTLLAEIRATFGHAILVDAHTGSPRRMGEHQVIIGTCRGASCAGPVVTATAEVFARHGLPASVDVSGYTGGNIVAAAGRPGARVHALQLEVNASLVMVEAPDEFIARVRRGEFPEHRAAGVARVRACLGELLGTLPRVVAELHGPGC